MSISLTQIIAAIEAKAAGVSSSTTIEELTNLSTQAYKVGGAISVYDSAGVFPIDSAYVGMVFSTTSGGLYVLDSTSGSWQSIVGSALSVPAGWDFPGENYGYVSGGYSGTAYTNTNMKNSYTSDGNATDVGNLLTIQGYHSGHSSETHGYYSGGLQPAVTDTIQKFTFSADADTTDVGNLLGTAYRHSSSSSSTHGYTAGGINAVPTTDYTVIQKFSFSTDGNATDVGDLVLAAVDRTSGQSSSTHGYTSGSANTNPDGIQKYSYTSDGNATDVGNLTVGRARGGGASSTTHGYVQGGYTPGAAVQNVIDKFSFASDGDATDVGDLTQSVRDTAGTSSTTHGYRYGGITTIEVNVIDKVSFSSDGNSTDVGDMLYTSASHSNVGCQY